MGSDGMEEADYKFLVMRRIYVYGFNMDRGHFCQYFRW